MSPSMASETVQSSLSRKEEALGSDDLFYVDEHQLDGVTAKYHTACKSAGTLTHESGILIHILK